MCNILNDEIIIIMGIFQRTVLTHFEFNIINFLFD